MKILRLVVSPCNKQGITECVNETEFGGGIIKQRRTWKCKAMEGEEYPSGFFVGCCMIWPAQWQRGDCN